MYEHIIISAELAKRIRASHFEDGPGVRQVVLLGPVPGHAHKEPHQEEEERLVHVKGEQMIIPCVTFKVSHFHSLTLQEILSPMYFLVIILILFLALPVPFYPEVNEPQVSALMLLQIVHISTF